MQVFQFLGFAVFLCASLAQAEQTISFPPKQPLVTFQAPDDWKAEMKNGSMFVVSPDGGDVIVEVMTMEAGMKDQAPALKEAKGVVDGDFKKLVLSPLDPTDSNVINVTLYGGGGEDDSGPAMINRAILKHPEAKHPVLFCLIAAKAKAAEHGAACGAMMNSIKADGRLGRDKSDYYVRNNDDYDNGEFALHVRDMASFKLLDSRRTTAAQQPMGRPVGGHLGA